MRRFAVITAWLTVFCLATAAVSVPVRAETGRRASAPIHVYTRDYASGTRIAFEEAVGIRGELTDAAFETSGNGDMAAKIGADVNGIGYVSLATDFAADRLLPLKYNGVEASVEKVLTGEYKLARPFNYVSRADGDFASEAKQELVEAFVAYMTESVEGRQFVLSAGGIVDAEAGRPWDEMKAEHPIVDQDNRALTIVTAGSTSVEETLTAALESFQPLAGMFRFNISQSGSGDAYKRVLGSEKDGTNASDIGFASRAFYDDEKIDEALASGTFCLDAVVLVLNAEQAPFDDLSAAQIKAIFTGEVRDFAAVADIDNGFVKPEDAAREGETERSETASETDAAADAA